MRKSQSRFAIRQIVRESGIRKVASYTTIFSRIKQPLLLCKCHMDSSWNAYGPESLLLHLCHHLSCSSHSSLLMQMCELLSHPKASSSLYPLARSLASPRSVMHADTSTRPRTWVDSHSRIPASAPELWPTTTAEASAPSSSLMNGNQMLSLQTEARGIG